VNSMSAAEIIENGRLRCSRSAASAVSPPAEECAMLKLTEGEVNGDPLPLAIGAGGTRGCVAASALDCANTLP
jgi:hypothetical protein